MKTQRRKDDPLVDALAEIASWVESRSGTQEDDAAALDAIAEIVHRLLGTTKKGAST